MLEVRSLSVGFGGERPVRVVDRVSLSLAAGAALGIVGESGSGKSTLGAAIIGLLPGSGRIEGGRVLFDGQDMTAASPEAARRMRGRAIAMIPQDASGALNPLFTAGNQIVEAVPRRLPAAARHAKALELLTECRVTAPEQRLAAYPHMLSGGIKQRVLGAMALAADAKLVIADEPTTALDVTVQAEYLRLLTQLRRLHGFALILISHDIGVVASTCERVAVMYAGQIVECGPTAVVLACPKHPYTRALLAARPSLDRKLGWLDAIPGEPPIPGDWSAACRFAPRCPQAFAPCTAIEPADIAVGPAHHAACLALLPPREASCPR